MQVDSAGLPLIDLRGGSGLDLPNCALITFNDEQYVYAERAHHEGGQTRPGRATWNPDRVRVARPKAGRSLRDAFGGCFVGFVFFEVESDNTPKRAEPPVDDGIFAGK